MCSSGDAVQKKILRLRLAEITDFQSETAKTLMLLADTLLRHAIQSPLAAAIFLEA
jgi:hypothetical protein